MAAMETVVALLVALASSTLALPPDLKTGESQQKIYEIIRSHEGRKYGEHGGHEYGEDEIPHRQQASRKRYGYLPLGAGVEAPAYYDAPASRDNNIYRENVAAYAPKLAPVPKILSTPHHEIVASPLSHSHYAIVDPVTKNHQYVTFEAPKHQPSNYILEEEPHYVAPVAKPHYLPPVKDYSQHHLLDSGHRTSGHGHYGDNSVHGESGHKSHKKHDISGHKSHSASGGHRDEHDHYHNRAHYERDRGYHYEKAYAYDRIRAHHDIGSSRGAHSGYRAHHGHEGHKDSGSDGAHGYSRFEKQDKTSGQGYGYLSPHHHAYGN